MTINLDLLDEESATQAIQIVAEIAEENRDKFVHVCNFKFLHLNPSVLSVR